MRIKEFKKLIKNENYDKIIEKYMKCEIYLTDKQLEIVCKGSKHHNGCAFKYGKWIMYEVECINEKNEKFKKVFYDKKLFEKFINKCKYSHKIKILSWRCFYEN